MATIISGHFFIYKVLPVLITDYNWFRSVLITGFYIRGTVLITALYRYEVPKHFSKTYI